MNFVLHHIQNIIDQYRLQAPLHLYLKSYYAEHKKLGSRDRRSISEAVYLYYRYCLFFQDKGLSTLQIIKYGIEKSGHAPAYLEQCFAEIEADSTIQPDHNIPFPGLSAGMDSPSYFDSIGRQPRLFIRLMHPVNHNLEKLRQHFTDIEVLELPFLGTCVVSLPNHSKVQDILAEKDYVVQDYASQLSLAAAREKIEIRSNHSFQPLSIWDVCSGAGGKTIMASQLYPEASVTATDIRNSILHNLRQRLKRYGIQNVHTLTADVTKEVPGSVKSKKFDLIITDVPCSGSGTWERTPEQLVYFNASLLPSFAQKQFSIAFHAAQSLSREGYLVYITCSVFRQENEEITELLSTEANLEILHQSLINGIGSRSDSMFYAILRKRRTG